MSLPVLALLLVGAPPTPGYYYRPAFQLAVKHGSFDPDTYADHREPSLHLSPPKIGRDFGQEEDSLELRLTQTASGADAEVRSASGWRPCRLRVVSPDRIETDLLGNALETLVRMPEDFETLAKRARAQRTAAKKKGVAGAYRSPEGATIRLDQRNPFELVRCLAHCQKDSVGWCVHQKRERWLLDEAAGTLTEIDGPAGVCPDGPAYEPKAGGKVFKRQGP